MEIKIKDSEVTFIKKTVKHTLEFGDKELVITEFQLADNLFDNYDSDVSVENEEDFTEDELQFINDNISDLIAGDITETDEICGICHKYQDEDGRCGCTNKNQK